MTIMGEQLVQVSYAVAWGSFGPAIPQLKGTEHTATPTRHTEWCELRKE